MIETKSDTPRGVSLSLCVVVIEEVYIFVSRVLLFVGGFAKAGKDTTIDIHHLSGDKV